MPDTDATSPPCCPPELEALPGETQEILTISDECDGMEMQSHSGGQFLVQGSDTKPSLVESERTIPEVTCQQCPYHCPRNESDSVTWRAGDPALKALEQTMQRFSAEISQLKATNVEFSEANAKVLEEVSQLKATNAEFSEANAEFSEANAKFLEEVSQLKATNAEFSEANAKVLEEVSQLKATNAELTARVSTLQGDVIILQGNMSTVQNETHALCQDKATIESAQIILRFLGRQDLSRGTTGYVRQAYENNVVRDSKAQSKVEVMLCTGLGIINNAEHSPNVDLLDEIINDRNGVAHPAKPGCGSMDAVIKNLEYYQASSPLVTPKERLILSILKCSGKIEGVERLVPGKDVV